ncbi:MAG: hypothetical protein B9S32_15155 [Verrucomicrobia bacterium Tous-C9LFEB]|nr:MAG: hypothetical protein B9S32_15155 [Verrucomicrobia bacterium Tous-C9LFEB]
MKKLNIGMVGIGFIADWHYNAFAKLSDAGVTAICQDFHGDAAKIAAKKVQLQQKAAELKITAYESFDKLLADPAIDALIIGSINPYHYDQIMAGLNAGKHLLVEKPVVTDLAQLDGIAKLAAQKKLVVFPGHNFAYRGAVQQAKAVIASGKLGRIVSSSFVSTHSIGDGHATGWRAKKSLATGGTLMDSGHHLVYQTLYLLGRPVAVSAFTSKLVRTNMECEDTAQVALQYADGSVCTVMQSIASNFGDGISGIRIAGEKGNLIITDALYVNGERIEAETDYPSSFAGQARAFVEAIRGGKPPVSTLDDVRETLRIIYGAYQSAEEKRTITL